MSNGLDPDLGPNCLPRLSADDTGRQRANLRIKFMNGLQNQIYGFLTFICVTSYEPH